DVLEMYSSSPDIHQISEDTAVKVVAASRAPYLLASSESKIVVIAPPIPATEYSGTFLGHLNTNSSSSSNSRSSNSTPNSSITSRRDSRKDNVYSSFQRKPRVDSSQSQPPLSIAPSNANSNGIFPSSSSVVAAGSSSASVGRNGGGGGGKLLLLNLLDELDAAIEKTRSSSDEFGSDSLPRERGRRQQRHQPESPVVAIPLRSESRSWRMSEFERDN
ncbi:hypothetical protein HK100_009871, partial [Physocladia obscura]